MTKAYLIEIEGRWYARYRKPDGKWTHKSMRTSKKAVAQVNFSIFLKKREERELQFSDVVPVTFGELVEEYLKYVKTHKSAAWHENQRLYIKGPEKRPDKKRKTSILEFFGASTLTTQITPRLIEKYAEHRRQFTKATTVNKELACIRHMMKKAAEWNNVAVNPALKVRDLPDDSTVRERFLAPDEYPLLLRTASDGGVGHAWNLPVESFTDTREFVVIGTNTGLRRAELLHLEFSDIDWERRVLTVKRKPHLDFHPKNYQHRFCPRPTTLMRRCATCWQGSTRVRALCSTNLTGAAGSTCAAGSTENGPIGQRDHPYPSSHDRVLAGDCKRAHADDPEAHGA
jgi:integrase